MFLPSRVSRYNQLSSSKPEIPRDSSQAPNLPSSPQIPTPINLINHQDIFILSQMSRPSSRLLTTLES